MSWHRSGGLLNTPNESSKHRICNHLIRLVQSARNASGHKSSGIGDASGPKASGIANSCGSAACGMNGALHLSQNGNDTPLATCERARTRNVALEPSMSSSVAFLATVSGNPRCFSILAIIFWSFFLAVYPFLPSCLASPCKAEAKIQPGRPKETRIKPRRPQEARIQTKKSLFRNLLFYSGGVI